jgi:hypothetical protein
MIYTYAAVETALFLLSLAAYFQVKKFLAAHNAIANESDMSNFRSLARGNMYLTLVYLVLSLPALLLSIYIGYAYGLLGIVAVFIFNGPHFLFIQHLKSLQERLRGLHCTPELSNEFHAVRETWHKRALPNF